MERKQIQKRKTERPEPVLEDLPEASSESKEIIQRAAEMIIRINYETDS